MFGNHSPCVLIICNEENQDIQFRSSFHKFTREKCVYTQFTPKVTKKQTIFLEKSFNASDSLIVKLLHWIKSFINPSETFKRKEIFLFFFAQTLKCVHLTVNLRHGLSDSCHGLVDL